MRDPFFEGASSYSCTDAVAVSASHSIVINYLEDNRDLKGVRARSGRLATSTAAV